MKAHSDCQGCGERFTVIMGAMQVPPALCPSCSAKTNAENMAITTDAIARVTGRNVAFLPDAAPDGTVSLGVRDSTTMKGRIDVAMIIVDKDGTRELGPWVIQPEGARMWAAQLLEAATRAERGS